MTSATRNQRRCLEDIDVAEMWCFDSAGDIQPTTARTSRTALNRARLHVAHLEAWATRKTVDDSLLVFPD